MPWEEKTPGPSEGRDTDPLDSILQDAVWPEIEPEGIERLRRRWAMVAQRRTRRIWRLAAAALIGLVVGSAVAHRLLVRRGGRDSPAPVVNRTSEGVSGHPAARPAQHSPPAAPDARASAGRTASPLEIGDAELAGLRPYDRLLVLTARRRMAQRSAKAPDTSMARLQSAIDQVVQDPDANIVEVCQPLLDEREKLEGRLADVVRESRGARRVAAVRLLAHLATARSLPLLVELHSWPPVHRETASVLARLASSTALARLAVAEPDSELQCRLMRALLERGDRRSVELFLNLVGHPATSTAAVQSARDASHPPVDALFEYLISPRVRQRLSAARVLGELNDPAVSQRLIELVFRSAAGREALAALSASREPLAAQFVDRARRDLSLAASLRAAQRRVASFPN